MKPIRGAGKSGAVAGGSTTRPNFAGTWPERLGTLAVRRESLGRTSGLAGSMPEAQRLVEKTLTLDAVRLDCGVERGVCLTIEGIGIGHGGPWRTGELM